MKLKYEKKQKLRMIFPLKMDIHEGKEYETDDKDLIKRLKEVGFKEVKQKKKEEGGK